MLKSPHILSISGGTKMDDDRRWELADELAEYIAEHSDMKIPFLMFPKDSQVLEDAVTALDLTEEIPTTEYWTMMGHINGKICDYLRD